MTIHEINLDMMIEEGFQLIAAVRAYRAQGICVEKYGVPGWTPKPCETGYCIGR